MSHPGSFERINRTFFWILGLLCVLVLSDFLYHYIERGRLEFHEFTEGLLVLFIILLVAHARSGTNHGLRMFENRLNEVTLELANYRKRNHSVLTSMREAVDEQFARWSLTESESRLAVLLIQGFSFKQVAGVLNKSEKTVRNQSQALYDKAGMTGRADLAAFFLQDLFKDEVDSTG